MEINQYDVVLLKDGSEATIVEKLSEVDFLADVGNCPANWDTIFLTLHQIQQVTYRYKASDTH